MSHNIEYNSIKGTHSMFSAKELPWHGLGQIVEGALTSEEAIKAANLGYEVIKIQNMAHYEGANYVSPGSFSTFRKDTKKVLGAVGKDYTIIQNWEAFSFFDAIVGEGKAIFETAGVLGNGEQIFITAKLPKSIVLDNVDQINQYLLLSNSHDGSRSIEVLFTPIRVVCNNTLTAALSLAKNRIKIRHTASAKDKLNEAHKLLGIHTELLAEQETMFNLMKDKHIATAEEFYTYVCNVFLTPRELLDLTHAGLKNLRELDSISTKKLNMMGDVEKYFVSGAGQELRTAKDTLWGAYNAITGYYQNAKDFKSDSTKKMRSNFYGSNYNKMHDAYKIAVDMAYGNIPILTIDGVKLN